MSVENGWDEVWVAVKFQTNLEIAGSLRNLFRGSLEVKNRGGRASQTMSDKIHRRKGNSPDHQLRSLNIC